MTNDQTPVDIEVGGRPWIKWGGLTLVLLGALVLIVWAGGLAQSALSLRRHLAQVQALTDDPQSLDPAAACGLVGDLRDDVLTLRRRAGGMDQLVRALGWVPRIGGDLEAVPHLLVVADGLTEAGVLMCGAMRPAITAFGGTDEVSDALSLEDVTGLLAERRSDLERALAAVERAQHAWMQVDAKRLSTWTAGKTELLKRGLPLLQAGLSVAMIAPDLLGVHEPRTYLILALNEDELRPTGGFITGVGEIRLEAGQLITMTFQDSYAVDDFTLPYPEAPEPMRRFMGIELLVFRDSNWSPDFPTAARQAIALYRPGHSVLVDGVIALDQRAVQELVGAVGPLTLSEVEEPVTGDTIIPYIHGAWAPPEEDTPDHWWGQRKSFMGVIAEAAWERVQGGQADWSALARTLLRLLDEKHLLLFLDHPNAAVLLAERRWDGALPSGLTPSGTEGLVDFLMVVDTNMGYNKADRRVNKAITYQVDLRQSPPKATLTLIYTHTGEADYPCRQDIDYVADYERLTSLCYWDYLRIYIPQGSRFLDATRIPVPSEALLTGEGTSGEVTVQRAEEGPWMTLGVLGLLSPATSQTRHFFWKFPRDVVKWKDDEGWYSLQVQKQPGTAGHPLTVQIRLPEGSRLADATPQPAVAAGGWVIYRVPLDRDREFHLHFRRRP